MATSRKLIEARVAAVLNSRELVINRGSKHGVKKGMRFVVYDADPRLADIKDPETGEILGSLCREVARVEAVEVTPRMAVARTYLSRLVDAGAMVKITNPFASQRRVYQTLKKDRSYGSGYEDLSSAASSVREGAEVAELQQPKETEGEDSYTLPPSRRTLPPSR